MAMPGNIVLRMQLIGQAQTIAGLNAATLATQRLNKGIIESGIVAERSAARQWLHNQALFTLRRVAYGGTIAVAAMTAGVVGFGLKFNSSMQQNMVAFTHFLGNTQLAEQYLDKLYDLAATTPFEFLDLTQATKRLIAFGFTADGAYRTMVNIGDAAAGLGIGKEGIDRMTLAFGQMQTNGRILGGELRQLAEVGVNARKYLQEAFNLTPDQMANIGRLHIPAEQGIEAILRGMSREFEGFAVKQSQTFGGLLSTLHDYAQKLFGTITKPLFERLSTTYLPRLVALSKELEAGFTAGGWKGMIQALDDNLGAGGKLALVWGRISSIAHSLGIIIQQSLWPAFVNMLRVISPLLAVLWPISWALKLMADHSQATGFVLKILLVWFVLTRIALVALRWAVTTTALRIQMLKNWIQITVYWTRIWVAWTWASARAQNGQFLAGYKNTGMLARLSRGIMIAAAATKGLALATLGAARAMMIFLLTNPVGWAILIITTLTILYFKWGWFHDKVNAIFFWIKRYWPLLAVMLLGPFGIFVAVIGKHISQIWALIKWVWDKAKEFWHWLQGIPVIGDWLGGGNDAQNTITAPGKPGPNLKATIKSPGFAAMTQANTFESAKMTTGDKPIVITSQLIVDKKVLAESVAQHGITREALR